ncbi:MAG: hypothetical protein HKN76_03225 [Saprospiraceae bacterium]|nr:hypothetical protein [Saprospiraceae bacterium]
MSEKTNQQIIQERIDSIAFDLFRNKGSFFDHPADVLAGLLDLCPEQNVWMYEPDPSDPESILTYATFRMLATNGTSFHMSCLLNDQSEVLEWIGPHDMIIPKSFKPARVQALAA